jgi:hypothetical protein
MNAIPSETMHTQKKNYKKKSTAHRVVAGPSVGCAMRVDLVILEINVLRGVGVTKGDLRSTTHVPGNHTSTNEVHNVHDRGHGHGHADVSIQYLSNGLVQILQWFRPGCDTAKTLSAKKKKNESRRQEK